MTTNSGAATASQPTAAQDDGLTPEQRKEKVAAEVRKAIADAEKAEADAVKAALPASEVKPVEGKVDVGEGAGLVGQTVAYRLLDQGAAEIATEVAEKLDKNDRVLIVDDRDLTGSDWAYQMVSTQLEKEEQALQAVLNAFGGLTQAEDEQGRGRRQFGTAVAAVSAVSTVLGAAASVAGMFKSNYAISARAVTIGPTPLLAALASHFEGGRATVDGFSLRDSQILDDFWGVRDKRLEVAEKAVELRAKTLDPADQRIESQRDGLKSARAELDKAIAAGSPTDALKQHVRDGEGAVEESVNAVADERALIELAEAAVERFDAFVAAVTTGERPPLLAASVRERLHKGDAKYTHVLFAAAEGAGAETITRQRNFGNAEAGFLGGVELAYLLLKLETDAIEAAGTKPLLGHVKYKLKDAALENLKTLQS